MTQDDWAENRDEADDRFADYGDSSDAESGSDFPAPDSGASQKGMSSTSKVLIVILCLGGLVCLLCCGVVGWFFYSFQDAMTEDPAEVEARTQEIAEIEIPDGFQPQMAMNMDFFVMEMNMVLYGDFNNSGSLMLCHVNADIDSNDPNQEREIRSRMQETSGDQRNLIVKNVEEKEFTIRGATVTVTFAEAEDANSGESIRQVTGSFKGEPRGTVIFIYSISEESYDEEEVVRMIESIK